MLLIGALYGSRLGAATMIAYLAEGAAGMPVFSSGLGGISAIATASGGYIFGFILAAYVVGWFAERGWDRSRGIVFPMLLANAVIYVPGLIWLHQQFSVVGTPITGIPRSTTASGPSSPATSRSSWPHRSPSRPAGPSSRSCASASAQARSARRFRAVRPPLKPPEVLHYR